MNGYIKKQALMDYCSNQVTRTVDLNDIARFPIAEIYTKADLVTMLEEVKKEIEEIDSRAGYDGNGMPTFSTDYIRKNKVNELIQQKINSLKEST